MSQEHSVMKRRSSRIHPLLILTAILCLPAQAWSAPPLAPEAEGQETMPNGHGQGDNFNSHPDLNHHDSTLHHEDPFQHGSNETVKWTRVLVNQELDGVRRKLESQGMSPDVSVTLEEGALKPGYAFPEVLYEKSAEGKLAIRILTAPGACDDGYSHALLLGVLKNLHKLGEDAEIALNAQAGSKKARLAILSKRYNAMNSRKEYYTAAHLLPQKVAGYKEQMAALEKEIVALAKEVKKEDSARKKAWEEYKRKVLNEQDKADVKFDELVARNDRKGVAELVRKYVPWDLLEPKERQAWEAWVRAIERKPGEGGRPTAWFARGLSGDLTRVSDDGKLLFVMPSMISSGQGNYNFRLRRFSSWREASSSSALDTPLAGKVAPVGSAAKGLYSHAGNPTSSPFLSTTLDWHIANQFSVNDQKPKKGSQIALLRMDPARMVINGQSMFSGEMELLVPFAIFPDEVAYLDVIQDANHTAARTEAAFFERASKALGQKVDKTLFSQHWGGPELNAINFAIWAQKRYLDFLLGRADYNIDGITPKLACPQAFGALK